ncbi:MAG: hypothetical protein Ct9H90mP6_01560 [Gammaproteobacteria bacterium]|nr:MAG: hypothetical protein Ct9H90mP6_01560 [Gammaproteobacteria bacterium]
MEEKALFPIHPGTFRHYDSGHRKDLDNSNILIVGDLTIQEFSSLSLRGGPTLILKLLYGGLKSCERCYRHSNLNYKEDLNKALKGQDVVWLLGFSMKDLKKEKP